MITKAQEMKIKDFYDRLISFKDSPEFHFYGFGFGGPYSEWRTGLIQYRNSGISDRAIMLCRQIHVLGLCYMKSKGGKTNETEQIDKILKQAIDL